MRGGERDAEQHNGLLSPAKPVATGHKYRVCGRIGRGDYCPAGHKLFYEIVRLGRVLLSIGGTQLAVRCAVGAVLNEVAERVA